MRGKRTENPDESYISGIEPIQDLPTLGVYAVV